MEGGGAPEGRKSEVLTTAREQDLPTSSPAHQKRRSSMLADDVAGNAGPEEEARAYACFLNRL